MNIKRTRKNLHLTQARFWGAIGVSQSAGSRYESGRAIPCTTLALLWMRWVRALEVPTVVPVIEQALKIARKHR